MKKFVLIGFSLFITLAVLLTSVHAKEVAAKAQPDRTKVVYAAKATDDLSAKAASDLHNHVEKTTFKAFVKVMNDQAVIARERDIKNVIEEYQRSLATALLEILLLFRLSLASVLR